MTEIPRALRDRPLWHGMPVPMNVVWDRNGTPDFASLNHELSVALGKARQCGMCGKRMRGEAAFIGGPHSLEAGLFRDGPMHPECARYAMQVCPFVSGTHRQYRSLDVEREHATPIAVHPTAPPPQQMGLIRCRRYDMLPGGLFHAVDRVGETEWVQ